MNMSQIDDGLFVGAQITPEDIPALKARGIRSILVNRPDNEGADQPTFAETAEAAKAAGIETRYVPIVSGQITEDDIAAFRAALSELPRPIFAHCRSGTRSTMMWALAQGDKRPADALIAQAAEAGFDISSLAPRLAG